MKRYRINAPKVLGQTMDGEAVVINLETGCYYSMNESGTAIWDQVAATAGLDRIVAMLGREYEGGTDEIESVARDFLAQLAREDLIVELDAEGEEGEVARAPASPAIGRRVLVTPVLDKYTDMQDLILLDPIHEVDEAGWPTKKSEPPEPGSTQGAGNGERDEG